MITVQSIDKTTFRVTVEGRTTTTHTVTLSSSYYEELTSKRVAPEALVEKSFEFLLERESNTNRTLRQRDESGTLSRMLNSTLSTWHRLPMRRVLRWRNRCCVPL